MEHVDMQQTSALALLETSESPQDRELSFPDEEPLTMLRDAVTELIKALNSALNNERGSAAECIQRAEAILEWNSRHSTPVAQVPALREEPPQTYRGGL